jgi:hypothetical protein
VITRYAAYVPIQLSSSSSTVKRQNSAVHKWLCNKNEEDKKEHSYPNMNSKKVVKCFDEVYFL